MFFTDTLFVHPTLSYLSLTAQDGVPSEQIEGKDAGGESVEVAESSMSFVFSHWVKPSFPRL